MPNQVDGALIHAMGALGACAPSPSRINGKIWQATRRQNLPGGASLVFLNRRPLSSAFYTKRSSFDLYIQTYRELDSCLAFQSRWGSK